MGNMTRRAFIQSAGALAAGAAAGGIAFPEHEIKEHGLVEIRAWFFGKDPIVLKSTIFSDARRDVFGVRLLGMGKLDTRFAEIGLADVKAAVDVPGRITRCTMTGWNGEGKKETGFMDLIVREGSLVIATPGELEKSPRPGPAWLALSDVRQVL
jgi:hypothetical protein